MKKTLILAALAVALVQCKKEKSIEEEPLGQPSLLADPYSGYFGHVPTDANGAFYSIRFASYGNTDSSEQIKPYLAWFGSRNQSLAVGTVRCDEDQLTLVDGQGTKQWYNFHGSLSHSLGNCDWKVDGTSDFGVINYSDNKPIAYVNNFVAPASVSEDDELVLSFTTQPCDSVRVRLVNTQIVHAEHMVNPGAGNVTFSSAELTTAIKKSSGAYVEVVTYQYTKQVNKGKTLYFVKENISTYFVEKK